MHEDDASQEPEPGAPETLTPEYMELVMNTYLLHQFFEHADQASREGRLFGDYAELLKRHSN